MTTNLKYDSVGLDEHEDVLTVGFANDQSNPLGFLLFQNGLAEDVEPEDGEIYIERDDQSQSACGGIVTLILYRDLVLLVLSLETAKAIATDQEVNIAFSATDEQFQQLKEGFEVIFGGKQILEVRY